LPRFESDHRGYRMDRQDYDIKREVADLEAELGLLLSHPEPPAGKRGELLERPRRLKLRVAARR
jgi:hypothetical protein